MPGPYKTPGVYIEEISKFPPSVAQVATAIPAFIGYTEKAMAEKEDDLRRVAKRISSMLDYTTYYGGAPKQALSIQLGADGLPAEASAPAPSDYKMFYSLQLYFANGGGPCYIVSVGSYDDAVSADDLGAKESAADPGGLTVIKKVDEVTLILFPDATALDENNCYTVFQSALDQCNKLQDRFTILDIRLEDDPVAGATTTFRDKIGNNLKYGAAYWPWLKTVFPYEYDDASLTFVDAGGTTMTTAPANRDASDFGLKLESAIGKLLVDLPPGGAVAGIYAAVDATRGVWKAPANVSVSSIVGPLAKLTDADQDGLNVDPTAGKSINAIRTFAGKGTLVWGARTLAGNDNEWRYVPVRRFFNMVEESVKKASAQFVFEPNDKNTWVKVRAMIENFLTLQWRQGALAGAKPEQAFYVRVGLGETMTAQDILEGRMLVEIGMAAVRPAEFIILRFSHKMQEA